MTWPGTVLLAMGLLTTATVGRSVAQTASQEASPSAAPSSSANQLVLTRASIQTQRQAIVAEAMDLDGAEMQTFWPLYRDYRLAVTKVDDRVVTLLSRYLENYPGLSDTQAGQLLDEMLSIEEARHSVRREYVARFRKVLPDRKVARFFQVERKLDAVVNAELAERVPLVE